MKKNFEKPTYNYQSILDVDLASNKIGNLTGKLTFILSDNDFVTLSRREIPKYYDAAPVIGRVKGYDNIFIQGVRFDIDNFLLQVYDFDNDAVVSLEILEKQIIINSIACLKGEAFINKLLGTVTNFDFLFETDKQNVNMYKNYSTEVTAGDNFCANFCKSINSCTDLEGKLYKNMFSSLKDEIRNNKLVLINKYIDDIPMNLISRSSYVFSKLKRVVHSSKKFGKLLMNDDRFVDEMYNIVKENRDTDPFEEYNV